MVKLDILFEIQCIFLKNEFLNQSFNFYIYFSHKRIIFSV